MLEDVFNFNGLFSKIGPGMCRLDLKGRIAIKTSKGYRAYNLKKKTLVNCTSFCFNPGEEMFFVVPTNNVEPGDIIIVDGTPRCVVKNDNNESIRVVNYERGVLEDIIPERHVFMGNVYFYGKIVSLMDGMFEGGNAFKNILMFKMMSQMLNGGKGDASNSLFGGESNGIFQLMLMQNLFKGGDNGLFGEMFDNIFKKKSKTSVSKIDVFGFDDDDAVDADEDEDAEVDEEEEAVVEEKKPANPKKAIKRSTK